ncbi:AAA family ATPase [Brucella pseudogrignonensis]|uniref:AAA family ATPase n=1 Tax=Brucella pseudogrignonensis TaxID=419475 RepID=UPI001E4DB00A|nr:AAA family ATPase [Brucella pseudogrignonensis]MCD4511961.1 AAA family ATPase [Brucella pseudogrignonensis]
MLIIFGGLPGSGKSTIAQSLASQINAVYLRIDSIEQAIRSSGILSPSAGVGPAGYMATYRVATDNLRLGRSVIADSVNPLEITRTAYRRVAKEADVRFLEVEVVCTDQAEHRHRVETRSPAVEGLTLPTWEQVETREYETWNCPLLRLDTARLSVEISVAKIITAISALT